MIYSLNLFTFTYINNKKGFETKYKNMEKSIYHLELNEVLNIPWLEITRVASGWIYRHFNEETQLYSNGVFVPFDNKFQIPEKKID